MSAGAAPGPARIGARRRSEAADDFRLMADSAPVMIWVADSEGRAVYFNRPWLEFTGRTLAREAGLGWTEGLHHEDRERTVERYLEAIHRCEPFELEYRLRRHDGDARWVLAKGVPVVRDGAVQGFVGSCLDITERRAAEEAARKRDALAHAESATLERDHFLSILSHDLRTPLNGIKTWAHFLEHELRDGDPTIRRAVAGIMIGVDQQARLIDDLLDLTRALSGKLSLARQPVALLPLLADVVDEYREAAAQRGVTFLARIDVDGAEVLGDAKRLRQVVGNLVANALRFTPEGGTIRIEAGVRAPMAHVEVADDGAGIPPEFQPYVFDPFRQAEQGSSRRVQQGVGLGLALVKHLARLHGGDVEFESAGSGRGSIFRVRLPLSRDASLSTHPAAVVASGSLEGVRVLLVDDQHETRESLAALLSQAGAQVRVAASGAEALSLVGDAGENEGLEVFLCDIAMPGEDGYAVLRRIRACESARSAQPRPAVAISAYSDPEDRARALAEGFEAYLAKPISPEELMDVIAKATGTAVPPVAAPGGA